MAILEKTLKISRVHTLVNGLILQELDYFEGDKLRFLKEMRLMLRVVQVVLDEDHLPSYLADIVDRVPTSHHVLAREDDYCPPTIKVL